MTKRMCGARPPLTLLLSMVVAVPASAEVLVGATVGGVASNLAVTSRGDTVHRAVFPAAAIFVERSLGTTAALRLEAGYVEKGVRFTGINPCREGDDTYLRWRFLELSPSVRVGRSAGTARPYALAGVGVGLKLEGQLTGDCDGEPSSDPYEYADGPDVTLIAGAGLAVSTDPGFLLEVRYLHGVTSIHRAAQRVPSDFEGKSRGVQVRLGVTWSR